MSKAWLKDEHWFLGRIQFDDGSVEALIHLQKDLTFECFFPYSDSAPNHKNIVYNVEGVSYDWNINANDIASLSGPKLHKFKELNNIFEPLNENINHFKSDKNASIWCEFEIKPRRVHFQKKNISSSTPDEWGLLFYPSENQNTLFHYFDCAPFARKPLVLMSTVDYCLYFDNIPKWDISSIHENRLDLLLGCLSLFVGTPISYNVLVGKKNKQEIYVCFNIIINKRQYECPSIFTDMIRLDNRSSSYKPIQEIAAVIEGLMDSSKWHKTLILLGYYNSLQMTLFDEMKIAMSYQVMESLAKYKHLKISNKRKNGVIEKILNQHSNTICNQCAKILQNEIGDEKDDFEPFIDRAVEVFRKQDIYNINGDELVKTIKDYRNELLHGDFLDNLSKADGILSKLNYEERADFPIFCQSIVTMIGLNFILEIDFSRMKPCQRKCVQRK